MVLSTLLLTPPLPWNSDIRRKAQVRALMERRFGIGGYIYRQGYGKVNLGWHAYISGSDYSQLPLPTQCSGTYHLPLTAVEDQPERLDHLYYLPSPSIPTTSSSIPLQAPLHHNPSSMGAGLMPSSVAWFIAGLALVTYFSRKVLNAYVAIKVCLPQSWNGIVILTSVSLDIQRSSKIFRGYRSLVSLWKAFALLASKPGGDRGLE